MKRNPRRAYDPEGSGAIASASTEEQPPAYDTGFVRAGLNERIACWVGSPSDTCSGCPRCVRDTLGDRRGTGIRLCMTTSAVAGSFECESSLFFGQCFRCHLCNDLCGYFRIFS
jgi:hypothetical protein